eukprot:3439828-Pyramimonas_sp.AAC.1
MSLGHDLRAPWLTHLVHRLVEVLVADAGRRVRRVVLGGDVAGLRCREAPLQRVARRERPRPGSSLCVAVVLAWHVEVVA